VVTKAGLIVLTGIPIFWLWAYLKKVIPEKC